MYGSQLGKMFAKYCDAGHVIDELFLDKRNKISEARWIAAKDMLRKVCQEGKFTPKQK